MEQILRVSAAMHIVFNIESDNIPENITQIAIDAAINFVEVLPAHSLHNWKREYLMNSFMTLIQVILVYWKWWF